MKKGFTLIELLGVIVILALLTLLVIPSIVNSVRDASEDTDDLTLELIYNASNLYISNHENNFPKIDGMKRVITLNELINDGLLAQPIKLSDKDVTNTMSVQVVYNGRYTYELKENEKCVNTLCVANTSKVNALVKESGVGTGHPGEESSYVSQEVGLLASEVGAYTPGSTYTCELGDDIKETFYVLEEKDNNISLIMSKNLISSSSGEPSTALEQIKEVTTDWVNINQNQINVPTVEQIQNAYDDTMPTWLASHTVWNCSSCTVNSYLTTDDSLVVSVNSKQIITNNIGWFCNGIRPVITISKSQLG